MEADKPGRVKIVLIRPNVENPKRRLRILTLERGDCIDNGSEKLDISVKSGEKSEGNPEKLRQYVKN